MASKTTVTVLPTADKGTSVLAGPEFAPDEWDKTAKTNPMAEAVASLVGTDKVLSVTAADESTRDRYVNQLHRAGSDIGKTVRTQTKTTPDGRHIVKFRVTDKQTRTRRVSTTEGEADRA